MRSLVAGLCVLMLVPLGACDSGEDTGDDTGDDTGAGGAPPATPMASAPATAESGREVPPVPDERSLPALMREEFVPGQIREAAVESRTAAYTRSRVTYEAGDLTISGVLLRPAGDGPFPGIVLNHGYIEPSAYRPGQGLAGEQDRLARAGFVVLHTDDRGHATSDEPVDDSTGRAASATPPTPSTRCWPSSASPMSTRTKWRCWGARWAVA